MSDTTIWTCTCNYQNLGPICTHCGMLFETLLALARMAPEQPVQRDWPWDYPNCEQCEGQHDDHEVLWDDCPCCVANGVRMSQMPKWEEE